MFRKKNRDMQEEEAASSPDRDDTLERIEAVTDRLEWLAQQLEEELQSRGGTSA